MISRVTTDMMIAVMVLAIVGCVNFKPTNSSTVTMTNPDEEKDGRVEIKEFMLSPGDEIKIAVYQHEELTRSVKIPPDGRFFYPIVGDVDISGKSLRELRDIINNGLSSPRDLLLYPGDEISIVVFRQEEFNRKFIIPSDGYFFFP